MSTILATSVIKQSAFPPTASLLLTISSHSRLRAEYRVFHKHVPDFANQSLS